MEAELHHSVSHGVPFATQLYLQTCIAVRRWSGSRSQVFATLSGLDSHWDSSQISCHGYLSHGDPAALVLQNWHLCAFQQFIDGIDV